MFINIKNLNLLIFVNIIQRWLCVATVLINYLSWQMNKSRGLTSKALMIY